eukprot:TRINITY_DN1983_c0_g2_i1.p1 TRINITY_DN1983_c0_g2~~TRINITY_DN1983_c0_g2_i1.p1  ORF type:complete len:439 (+),score=120.39 TRINITY_DN1983_c0_g2_i1:288-1604(+)
MASSSQPVDDSKVDGTSSPSGVQGKSASPPNFYVASYKSGQDDDDEEVDGQVEETIEVMEETDDEDQEGGTPKPDNVESQSQKGVGAVPVEDEGRGTPLFKRSEFFAKFDRPIPHIPLPTTAKEIKAALLKCGWQKEEFDYYKMKRILPPDDLIPYRKRILQLADATSMKPTADVFGVSSATLYLWKRAKPTSNDRSSDCLRDDDIESLPDPPKEKEAPTPKQSREKRITIENRQSPMAALANSVESLGNLVSDILTRLSKLEKELNINKTRNHGKRKRIDSSDDESDSESDEEPIRKKKEKKVSQQLFQEVLSQLVKSKNKNKRLKELTKERDDHRWMNISRSKQHYPSNDLDQDDIETWVSCSRCKKWRKLVGSSAIPTTSKWYCEMNEDTKYNNCDHPEETGRGYRGSSSSSSSSSSATRSHSSSSASSSASSSS